MPKKQQKTRSTRAGGTRPTVPQLNKAKVIEFLLRYEVIPVGLYGSPKGVAVGTYRQQHRLFIKSYMNVPLRSGNSGDLGVVRFDRAGLAKTLYDWLKESPKNSRKFSSALKKEGFSASKVAKAVTHVADAAALEQAADIAEATGALPAYDETTGQLQAQEPFVAAGLLPGPVYSQQQIAKLQKKKAQALEAAQTALEQAAREGEIASGQLQDFRKTLEFISVSGGLGDQVAQKLKAQLASQQGWKPPSPTLGWTREKTQRIKPGALKKIYGKSMAQWIALREAEDQAVANLAQAQYGPVRQRKNAMIKAAKAVNQRYKAIEKQLGRDQAARQLGKSFKASVQGIKKGGSIAQSQAAMQQAQGILDAMEQRLGWAQKAAGPVAQQRLARQAGQAAQQTRRQQRQQAFAPFRQKEAQIQQGLRQRQQAATQQAAFEQMMFGQEATAADQQKLLAEAQKQAEKKFMISQQNIGKMSKKIQRQRKKAIDQSIEDNQIPLIKLSLNNLLAGWSQQKSIGQGPGVKLSGQQASRRATDIGDLIEAMLNGEIGVNRKIGFPRLLTGKSNPFTPTLNRLSLIEIDGVYILNYNSLANFEPFVGKPEDRIRFFLNLYPVSSTSAEYKAALKLFA